MYVNSKHPKIIKLYKLFLIKLDLTEFPYTNIATIFLCIILRKDGQTLIFYTLFFLRQCSQLILSTNISWAPTICLTHTLGTLGIPINSTKIPDLWFLYSSKES